MKTIKLLDLVTDDIPKEHRDLLKDLGMLLEIGNDSYFLYDFNLYKGWSFTGTCITEEGMEALNKWLKGAGVEEGERILVSYWW